MKKLSHVDKEGRARMVDVGHKDIVNRVAKAAGTIKLSDETLLLIKENGIKKGDVIAVAEIAGVMAAKQTSLLIPLCHNIPLENVQVTAKIVASGIHVSAEASCKGQTGVEMETLTAVSIALLTIYDMCKAVDNNMEISEIRLVEKIKLPIQV